MSDSKDVQEAKLRLEQARAQLDADIATLSDRLPASATMIQTGLAGGGGLAALGVVVNWLKGRLETRSEEKSLAREAEIQAKAIATAIAAQTEAHRLAEEERAARDEARAEKAERKAARKRSRTKQAAGAGAAVVAATQAAEAAVADAHDDDDGPSWGLILLVLAAVGVAIAYVTSQQDDDIWITDEP